MEQRSLWCFTVVLLSGKFANKAKLTSVASAVMQSRTLEMFKHKIEKGLQLEGCSQVMFIL